MLYEIHMMKHYPPANLNRDDTGSPKTCYFGGSLRGRISSQCLKRSWRTSELFETLLGERGIRSQKFPDLVKAELLSRGMDEEMAEAARVRVITIGKSEKKDNAKKKEETTEKKHTDKKEEKCQVMFFSKADVSAVASVIESWAKGKSPEQLKKMPDKDLKKTKDENPPITTDIALFGRMVTSDAFHNVEAAVQTAHAISTHTVNQESDYFTAVDDLLGASETGAGMLGDVEYNSCCYYHYMSIDTDQLEKNLAHSPEAKAHIAKLLPAMIEIMAYSNPSGKQNSFASHVLPEVLYVEVKDKKIPVSYANAFETPVRFGSNAKVVESSVKKLVEEIDLIEEHYGLEKKHSGWFAPRYKDITPKTTQSMASLRELLASCEDWISK